MHKHILYYSLLLHNSPFYDWEDSSESFHKFSPFSLLSTDLLKYKHVTKMLYEQDLQFQLYYCHAYLRLEMDFICDINPFINSI